MADERYTGKIDSFTDGYIKKRARNLVGKFGITESDREEIEQELRLKLAKYLPPDDPEDPHWKAFVARTVSCCIANIVRDKRAEKRDHRRVRSIHIVIGVDDDCPVELSDTIDEYQTPARRLRSRRSEQELAQLRIDLEEQIDEIPDARYREFCERLKYDSISQVARDMNIPRTTLNSWLSKLRQRFEDRGLRDYL